MCIWGCGANSNVLHPDGKWDDGEARMRKQLMILQIANRTANVSTNDIPRTRQWSTCQSQLLGLGEKETKIKSKYTLYKHKYKCMILLQKTQCFSDQPSFHASSPSSPRPITLKMGHRLHTPPEAVMGSLTTALVRNLQQTCNLKGNTSLVIHSYFR